MYEKFGKFASCVAKLDDAQNQVGAVWKDSVGNTYSDLNENIKNALFRIWSAFQECSDAVSAVKANYCNCKEDIDTGILLLAQELEDK